MNHFFFYFFVEKKKTKWRQSNLKQIFPVAVKHLPVASNNLFSPATIPQCGYTDGTAISGLENICHSKHSSRVSHLMAWLEILVGAFGMKMLMAPNLGIALA